MGPLRPDQKDKNLSLEDEIDDHEETDLSWTVYNNSNSLIEENVTHLTRLYPYQNGTAKKFTANSNIDYVIHRLVRHGQNAKKKLYYVCPYRYNEVDNTYKPK